MFLEFAAAGWLAGNYIYHRYIEDHPKPKPARELDLPRQDDGASVPILYGRCRIRSPILIWAGTPVATAAEDLGDPSLTGGALFLYEIDLAYAIAISATGGVSKLHHIWVGDELLRGGDMGGLTGNGGFEVGLAERFTGTVPQDGVGYIGSGVEFLNGNDDQTLVDPVTLSPTTFLGSNMIASGIPAAQIPGYRNYLVVHLRGFSGQWVIGGSPQIQAYSFEASSFPVNLTNQLDDDANPADVLYDLLMTGRFGKVGLTTVGGGDGSAAVDYESFRNASETLYDEGHGYSRVLDEGARGQDIVAELLAQMDATIYPNPYTGRIELKLIRGDYDPTTVRRITVDNCQDLVNPAFSGFTDVPNKIRLGFTDRANDYNDNSVTSQNQANAVGQGGQVREVFVSMPGVCTEEQAQELCERELAARSRPMFKCQAIVDHSFIDCVPGEVVSLTWPDYNLANLMMRVAAPARGSLQDNSVTLDLIQDFFTVERGVVVGGGGSLPAFESGISGLLVE